MLELKPPPDRQRLGRRSRTKGRVWERSAAIRLREIFPGAKRGFQSRSGRDGCDVEGTPFWVECKHAGCVDIRAALRQARKDTDGRPVAVVCKDDKKPPGWKVGEPNFPPFVVMSLDDWLALVRAAQGGASGETGKGAAGCADDELGQ